MSDVVCIDCLGYRTLALISSAASRDQIRIIPLSEEDIKG